jgi:uncharacterized cupin superfamily protein
MSNLIVFDLENLGAPRESKALPDRLVEGDSSYKTWEKDNVDGGRIRSGIWEATPGATRSIKGATWEYCTILSGVMELTEDGKTPCIRRRRHLCHASWLCRHMADDRDGAQALGRRIALMAA